MSKTRPTLFKSEMVNAIKNTAVGVWPPEPIDSGKPFKSHTRRLGGLEEVNKNPDGWGCIVNVNESINNSRATFSRGHDILYVGPPLGIPGDLLYVREGWRYAYNLVKGFSSDAENHIQFRADGLVYEIKYDKEDGSFYTSLFPNQDKQGGSFSTHKDFGRWRSSIHMFKWMSRFWLEIKSVRVERLQDITDNDIIAEGAIRSGFGAKFLGIDIGSLSNALVPDCLQIAFSLGWDSINKKSGYTWDYNPYVFVYEFGVKEAII